MASSSKRVVPFLLLCLDTNFLKGISSMAAPRTLSLSFLFLLAACCLGIDCNRDSSSALSGDEMKELTDKYSTIIGSGGNGGGGKPDCTECDPANRNGNPCGDPYAEGASKVMVPSCTLGEEGCDPCDLANWPSNSYVCVPKGQGDPCFPGQSVITAPDLTGECGDSTIPAIVLAQCS